MSKCPNVSISSFVFSFLPLVRPSGHLFLSIYSRLDSAQRANSLSVAASGTCLPSAHVQRGVMRPCTITCLYDLGTSLPKCKAVHAV